MLMERETLIFYKEWSNILEFLDEDARLEVYDAVFNYAFSGELLDFFSEKAKKAFEMFKPQIDKDQAKYIDICNKRREAARKSRKGKRKQIEANDSKSEQKRANANTCKQMLTDDSKSEQKPYDNNKFTNVNYDISTIIESDTNVLDSESVSTETDPPIDWSSFINWWNNNVHNTNIPELKTLNEDRRKAVRCRIKEHKKASLGIVMQKLVASSFLHGVNSRNFIATFDWVFKKANYTKILEGNYDNKDLSNGTTINPTSTSDGRSQREADAAEIVERLLNSQ